MCQKHKREICCQCSTDFTIENKVECYNRFVTLSHNLSQEEEENNLRMTSSCSNPNCQSKWPRTEDFTPPIINHSDLRRCQSCRRVMYCSKSCLKENFEEQRYGKWG